MRKLRHSFRSGTKYAFTCSGVRVVEGLPAGSAGLLVQLSRGPKLCSTEEAGSHSAAGSGEWEQKLSFVATLVPSKTGKSSSFSDKMWAGTASRRLSPSLRL